MGTSLIRYREAVVSVKRIVGYLAFSSLALALSCGTEPLTDPPDPGENEGPWQGGTFPLANGAVQISVPPGAHATAITVTATPASAPPASSRLVAGSAYDIGPDGTQFSQPVSLRLSYDGLTLPQGVLSTELRVHKLIDSQWHEVPRSTVDTTTKTVTVEVTSFSTYGILGVAVAVISVEPSTPLVAEGQVQQFNARMLDADGAELAQRPVEWACEETAVATIDSEGLLTAASVGSATITATADGVNGTAELTVRDYIEQEFELTAGFDITMVWIPPGEFYMGSREDEPWSNDNERPVHLVDIRSGFWLSKYEVTQSQWEAVTGSNPVRPIGIGVGTSFPVFNVSWEEVQEFLLLANPGFRLPTEAEWEYSVRAGTETVNFWAGSEYRDSRDDFVVGGRDYDDGPAVVGSKLPNAWGIHDAIGNASEWVEDDYHANYIDAPTDGSAWIENPRGIVRVLRGGSWRGYASSAWRTSSLADRNHHYWQYYYYPTFGFRVVYDSSLVPAEPAR